MAGGALFTEDIWKIICEGLRGAMRSTLAPIKHLIPCYQVGSSSVSGDDGYRVRVLTRRDASWEQTIRHGQLAEQVSELTLVVLVVLSCLLLLFNCICILNTYLNTRCFYWSRSLRKSLTEVKTSSQRAKRKINDRFSLSFLQVMVMKVLRTPQGTLSLQVFVLFMYNFIQKF